MAETLVQEIQDRFPGFIQVTGGRISIDATRMFGWTSGTSGLANLEDDQLIGFLYQLFETVSSAEDSWLPPAGTKKINSLTIVKSTSLQSIGNGDQGVFNQATIRVMQPISMQSIQAVRS